MRKNTCFFAMSCYVIALLCLVLYFFAEFSRRIVMPPATRLLLLGIVCLFIYLGSRRLSKATTGNTSYKIMKTTFVVFFALYLFLLVCLLLFDAYFGRTGISPDKLWNADIAAQHISYALNIVPFKTILTYISGAFIHGSISKSVAITNLLGNFVAFAPFAFFLPLLFRKQRTLPVFTVTMLGIVVAVELLQLVLLTGACDIDDVILNVFGAVSTYLLLRLAPVQKQIQRFTKPSV